MPTAGGSGLDPLCPLQGLTCLSHSLVETLSPGVCPGPRSEWKGSGPRCREDSGAAGQPASLSSAAPSSPPSLKPAGSRPRPRPSLPSRGSRTTSHAHAPGIRAPCWPRCEPVLRVRRCPGQQRVDTRERVHGHGTAQGPGAGREGPSPPGTRSSCHPTEGLPSFSDLDASSLGSAEIRLLFSRRNFALRLKGEPEKAVGAAAGRARSQSPASFREAECLWMMWAGRGVRSSEPRLGQA